MFKIKLILKFIITKTNLLIKKNNFLIIFRYGSAIGDHICLTGVISKIYNKKLKIIVCSNYPELFYNNPKIFKIINLNKFLFKKILLKFLHVFEGESIKSYRNRIIQTKKYHFMKFYPKNLHFGFASAYHFDIDMNYKNFSNEIFLNEKEISVYKNKIKLPNSYALIHSQAKKTFMKNKDWGPEKIQTIVNEFKNINWIQVGQPGEIILNNTYACYYDLTLRELGYLIYNSKFIVSMEGMFNHMASAFNKKNFLIHTGVLPLESINYPNNIVIEKNSELKCYPCFSFNCIDHKKHNDENLTVDYAINIIKKNF